MVAIYRVALLCTVYIDQFSGLFYVREWHCYAKRATSISANADGPRDAASRKINHIALPTEYSLYSYQETSVGR